MATPMGAALAETQISKEFAFVGPRLTRTTRWARKLRGTANSESEKQSFRKAICLKYKRQCAFCFPGSEAAVGVAPHVQTCAILPGQGCFSIPPKSCLEKKLAGSPEMNSTECFSMVACQVAPAIASNAFGVKKFCFWCCRAWFQSEPLALFLWRQLNHTFWNVNITWLNLGCSEEPIFVSILYQIFLQSNFQPIAMASSSSSRATKLQKIDSLRRSCPYVSQAALEALLKKVKEEGVPEVSHSKAMKEATRHYLSSMDAYGKLLMQVQVVTVDGNTKPIWIANALSLLAGAYRQGGAWAAMLQRVHGQRPSSYTTPWRLLLYADEVVPGNSLAHRQERKTHAIYASFAEFHSLLSCEDAWFIVAMLRSPEVADIQASIGQVFAKILESIFCSPVADPRTGLCLPHLSDSAQDLKLFFTMGGWLQDGLSMKLTFSTKGGSGDKFCMLRNNIRAMPMDSDTSEVSEEDILGSTVSQLAACELATDREVLDAFQACKAKAATMSKDNFTIHQQAAGISFNAHCLLLNQARTTPSGNSKTNSMQCFGQLCCWVPLVFKFDVSLPMNCW